MLLRAYIVYIRPILEYNCVVWSPQLKQDTDCIERVQRRFTKRLPNLRHMSYDNSLSVLDVPTSELRRLHVDLIWCYQIVFNLVCLNCDDFFEYCPVSTMRRHPYKLYKKHCNSNVRRNYFSNKMINVWNSLPLTVNFSTLHSFKYSTERVDFKQFLVCN